MWAKIGGSIMALMGLGCLCFSLFYVSQEVLLAATGHSTTGAVTEKTTSTDENNNISYYLSYSYEDDNGHAYTAKSDVSKAMYDGSVEGAPLSSPMPRPLENIWLASIMPPERRGMRPRSKDARKSPLTKSGGRSRRASCRPMPLCRQRCRPNPPRGWLMPGHDSRAITKFPLGGVG